MTRFAQMQSGRDYDFSPTIRYQGVSQTFGDAMKMGSVVPGLYNQAAKTGWQPNDTLATSIGLRATEKAESMAAEARVKQAKMIADATVESAKLQADAAKDSADSQSKGSMIGSTIGTVATIGAALLSDESTKNSVEKIENALKTLRELKPVTFYYNEEYSSNPERLHHGFIAQEYQKVMPDATYFDESIGKLCINTNELIALLVRAIQQLEGRLTYLEAVNALTGVK